MKPSERLSIYLAALAEGPKPVTEVVLLEGPWGECGEVSESAYLQLCRDYGGHPSCRQGIVTAQGKLDRALGKGGRTSWVVQQVQKQLAGAYWWDGNRALFSGDVGVTWKHRAVKRLEEPAEVGRRAIWLATKGK